MAEHATKQRSHTAPSIQQALTLHQQGRLPEAELLYGDVLATDPENFDALHLSGVLYHQQGRSAEALRLVGAALKTQPKSADVLTNYGVILDALERHQEALAAFDEALATGAESTPIHYNRGRTLASLGRHADALASYNQALAIAPKHIDARFNRGNVLTALGRHQEALTDYDAVLASRPDHAPVQNRRGNALIALKRHQEALAAYDAVLALMPNDAEAFNNRSVALTELGRCEEALQSCERALAARPDYAEALYNRGNALLGLSRFEDACANYRAALALEPRRIDALNNFGLALLALKQAEEALEQFQIALAIDVDHFETLHNGANALLALDRFEEALAACDKSLAQKPAQQDALNTRGVVLGKLGRHEEALASYDAALAAAARPDIEINRGTALINLDRFGEALASFDKVIAQQPDNIVALIHRGNACLKDKRAAEGLASFEQALAVDPNNPLALTVRGVALALLDRFDEAIACHEQAIRIEPHIVGAHLNRGTAMLKLSRPQEALDSYTEALARDPLNAEINFNAAITRLCMGDYREGWKLYEHRWGTKHFAGHRRTYPQPMWGGEDINGKIVLLHAEQGMGDVIQFVRYAPLVVARGAEVILAVPQPLKILVATVPGISLVVAHGEGLPVFDLHCPLLSLPLAFGTELDTVPANVPYLQPFTERLAAWRPHLPDNGKARVGLCWAGNPDFANDRHRSIAFERFAKLFGVPGIDYISLQKGVSPPQAALLEQHGILQLGEKFEDYADTAAVVAMLDLVVAVDTSVAHLAGAMGKVTALLLPFAPDWRWLLDRTDSPWYPSMRLFRQTAIGDWDEPIERLRSELAEVARRRAKPQTQSVPPQPAIVTDHPAVVESSHRQIDGAHDARAGDCAKDGRAALRTVAGYFVQPEDLPPLCAPLAPYAGPRLDLRDVTLVVIETLLHDLARQAVLDCVRYADYGEVAIFSDRPIAVPNATWHPLLHEDSGRDAAARLVWSGEILDRIGTKAFQLVHWDSWIVDPALWTPAFLDYDYIGAPWWYQDGRNVGCGAFAIRSTRLMRYLVDNADRYPFPSPEDDILCRQWRPQLEQEGFTWAPETLALQFAFECARAGTGRSRHFGFHEFRNWPLVLGREQLVDRVRLAMRSEYIRGSGKLDQLWRCAPWLRSRVGD